jgi:hypothetical protein
LGAALPCKRNIAQQHQQQPRVGGNRTDQQGRKHVAASIVASHFIVSFDDPAPPVQALQQRKVREREQGENAEES